MPKKLFYYEFWVDHNRQKEQFFEDDKKAIAYGNRYVFPHNIVNIYKHEESRVLIASWKNDKRVK